MHETEIHKSFMHWMDAVRLPYRHDRTDKRTRTTPGEPDFLLAWYGKCLYIEVKVIGNTLSPEQNDRHKYLRAAGNRVVIAFSDAECIHFAEEFMNEAVKEAVIVRNARLHK